MQQANVLLGKLYKALGKCKVPLTNPPDSPQCFKRIIQALFMGHMGNVAVMYDAGNAKKEVLILSFSCGDTEEMSSPRRIHPSSTLSKVAETRLLFVLFRNRSCSE